MGFTKVNAHVGNTNCGTSGLPISVDAFQTTTDNNDFYFISIDENASKLIFATYFGGASSDEHVDGGTSRFDKKVVFIKLFVPVAEVVKICP
jgi:hypothetical protein